MRMNATCRNLHMCKQYEIFTSYKISKKDRYCWIVSLIQNRNCTSDAALVWVYPAFKVQVSFLEWRISYIVKQWRLREILQERSWVILIKYLDLCHPYLCISKLYFLLSFESVQKKKFSIHFQDGDQIGQSINTKMQQNFKLTEWVVILDFRLKRFETLFYVNVTLILSIKFLVSWHFNSGEV